MNLIFVVLDLDSRKLIHINATLHPDQQWITQQFQNALFDFDIYPSLCISDRDSIYGKWLTERLKNYYDMKHIQTPYKQPWKNGKVERIHLSLKKEAFSHFIPITQAQIQKRCWQYKKYYNGNRCHQALAGAVPESCTSRPHSQFTGFQKVKHLAGAITSFEPAFDRAA
jgi:putative transposase